jgi:hypothetical protein
VFSRFSRTRCSVHRHTLKPLTPGRTFLSLEYNSVYALSPATFVTALLCCVKLHTVLLGHSSEAPKIGYYRRMSRWIFWDIPSSHPTRFRSYTAECNCCLQWIGSSSPQCTDISLVFFPRLFSRYASVVPHRVLAHPLKQNGQSVA